MLKKVTMAAYFHPKPTRSYNVRSISFPGRSHPNIFVKLEEELNNLRFFETSSSSMAEAICARLSSLAEMYRCIEDLLNLPMTQQALAQYQREKWLNHEMLDDLIKLLDICSNTRDAILLFKERVRELQSSLRRSKVGGELSNIDSNVNAYIFSRKKMKKELAKSLLPLKGIDIKCGESPLFDADHHLSAVVRVVREASSCTISIFSSLLLFLSVPILKPKLCRWSVVSKWIHRGVVACEGEQEKMDELETVDAVVTNLLLKNASRDLVSEMVESALRRLELLDISIEEIENKLHCLFRRLIQTRVSLLNILSH